jgi:hypothetical protein
MKCPCCGGTMPSIVPTSALSAIPMPDSERAILDLAVAAYPLAVSSAAIINGIWGGRADGGAMDTTNGIGVRVHRLNKKLKPVGWRVVGAKGSWHGRRLEPLIPSLSAEMSSPGISRRKPLEHHAARG